MDKKITIQKKTFIKVVAIFAFLLFGAIFTISAEVGLLKRKLDNLENKVEKTEKNGINTEKRVDYLNKDILNHRHRFFGGVVINN